MKKIYSIIVVLLIGINLFCQTGFSYQGVLRDSGKLRTNENLELTASLVQNSMTVYTETHHVTTNGYGVFSMVIGNGVSSAKLSPSLFMNLDSTSIITTFLLVKEGDNVISNTQILGVPFAEVAKVALKAYIDFPAGSIIAFGGDISQIPDGWLLCDGKGYDKTAYPELFEAIAVNWGTDGSLFRVPDLRGVFLRGVNGSAADSLADPEPNKRINRYDGGRTENNVGSYQKDTFASHLHNFGLFLSEGRGTASNHCYTSYPTPNSKLMTEETGGSETRPVNAYVNYIIKF